MAFAENAANKQKLFITQSTMLAKNPYKILIEIALFIAVIDYIVYKFII